VSAPEGDPYEASVVIVSFNTRNVLRECCQSIERESCGLRIETFVDHFIARALQEVCRPDVIYIRVGASRGGRRRALQHRLLSLALESRILEDEVAQHLLGVWPARLTLRRFAEASLTIVPISMLVDWACDELWLAMQTNRKSAQATIRRRWQSANLFVKRRLRADIRSPSPNKITPIVAQVDQMIQGDRKRP